MQATLSRHACWTSVDDLPVVLEPVEAIAPLPVTASDF